MPTETKRAVVFMTLGVVIFALGIFLILEDAPKLAVRILGLLGAVMFGKGLGDLVRRAIANRRRG